MAQVSQGVVSPPSPPSSLLSSLLPPHLPQPTASVRFALGLANLADAAGIAVSTLAGDTQQYRLVAVPTLIQSHADYVRAMLMMTSPPISLDAGRWHRGTV